MPGYKLIFEFKTRDHEFKKISKEKLLYLLFTARAVFNIMGM